jgi:uncharacterized membrane protein
MYFTLTQLQYLMLALFGGLLLVLVLVVSYWSWRLSLKRKAANKTAEEEVSTAGEDEVSEGNKPVPLVIVLLFAATLIWAVAYVIAVALGGINVQ